MEVKIKNKGKVKNFNLIKSWEDVTLENWIKLINHKTKSKGKEALNLIGQLSNIPKDIINKLELSDIAVLMARISHLQQQANTKLARVVEIDGIRYGFHPDLDSITLGEYADLEHFIKIGVEKNMPEVMAILYRPIVKEENNLYTIEAYDGEIKLRAEVMKKMSSQQVQNALVFFYHFGRTFAKTMQLFLMDKLKVMKKQSPATPLQKNGVGSE